LSPHTLFSHYSIPAFDEGQWPRTELGESIKSQKSRVPADVILLSKLNPEIERVWLVDVQPGERAVCSTEFLVLRSRAPSTRSYAYCLARSALFKQRIEALVTGTSKSHQRAHADAVLGLSTINAPALLISTFDKAASSLLERTRACRRESRTLAALRDALLPKLISGDLRVPITERVLTEHT
jgi:type I restriction enzyme S subunit